MNAVADYKKWGAYLLSRVLFLVGYPALLPGARHRPSFINLLKRTFRFMSINKIRCTKNPERVVGYFVTVSIGGEMRKDYLSVSKLGAELALMKARYLDALWGADKVLYQYRRFVSEPSARTHPLHAVSAHGLRLDFTYFPNTGQNVPVIEVTGKGGTFSRHRISDNRGLSQAWHDAVFTWAECHGIEDVDREALLARPPRPQQFKDLRRFLNDERGRDIGVDELGPVFKEQRDQLRRRREQERARALTKRQVLDDEVVQIASWFERESAGAV